MTTYPGDKPNTGASPAEQAEALGQWFMAEPNGYLQMLIRESAETTTRVGELAYALEKALDELLSIWMNANDNGQDTDPPSHILDIDYWIEWCQKNEDA